MLSILVLICIGLAQAQNGLKIQELVQCPLQIEPLGCWKDERDDRALPNLVLTGRDKSSASYAMPDIDWKNYNQWLSNFICECAKKILKTKNVEADVIGIQYYAECWGDLANKVDDEYMRHQGSGSCVTGDYSPFNPKGVDRCEVHSGMSDSMFAYKISKYHRTCPEIEGDYGSFEVKNKDTLSFWGVAGGDAILMEGHYFNGCAASGIHYGSNADFNYNPENCELSVLASGVQTVYEKKDCKPSIVCPYFQNMGCWNDFEPRKDPRMEVYTFNDRDESDPGFSGILLPWKQWDKGYLANLLCRCAKVAKQQNKKYFSIQYYAECWISDDLPRAQRDGKSTACVNKDFKSCDITKTQCKPQLCAGVEKTNQVYMIEQGPMMCASNPCPADKKCVTLGDKNYKCV